MGVLLSPVFLQEARCVLRHPPATLVCCHTTHLVNYIKVVFHSGEGYTAKVFFQDIDERLQECESQQGVN